MPNESLLWHPTPKPPVWGLPRRPDLSPYPLIKTLYNSYVSSQGYDHAPAMVMAAMAAPAVPTDGLQLMASAHDPALVSPAERYGCWSLPPDLAAATSGNATLGLAPAQGP